MRVIKTIFAIIRKEKLAAKITKEIRHRIIPQVKGRTDHGYPFNSKNELHRARLDGSSRLRTLLCDLDAATSKMQETERNAFLFVVHREIEEKLQAYLEIANDQTNRANACELHLVAVPL